MAHLPTSELVAVAWLAGVAGLPSNKYATTLPSDTASFNDGMVIVSVVGGSPDPHVATRRPVIQIDCWVATEGGSKPRWGRAADLAELIRQDTVATAKRGSRVVSLPAQYDSARVMSVYLISEPRRIEGDPNRHARYQFDLQFHWTVTS